MAYTGMIAGLGNPGSRYDGTRHNYGFILVDLLLDLAQREGSLEEMNGKKFHALLWRFSLPQMPGQWLAIKPLTFMNESGHAIQPALAWHKMSAAQLIVAHDELDLPCGQLRFKFGGGLAGHNGLASIAQRLDSNDFYRLRIGIDKPQTRDQVIDWVLSRPEKEDREKIRAILPFAIETLFIFSRDGLNAAAVFARNAGRLV